MSEEFKSLSIDEPKDYPNDELNVNTAWPNRQDWISRNHENLNYPKTWKYKIVSNLLNAIYDDAHQQPRQNRESKLFRVADTCLGYKNKDIE